MQLIALLSFLGFRVFKSTTDFYLTAPSLSHRLLSILEIPNLDCNLNILYLLSTVLSVDVWVSRFIVCR